MGPRSGLDVFETKKKSLSPVGNRTKIPQQHCYHHAPTVKPEAATAVVELLMMGVKTPETC
jgi:endonuclease V-like protein UPF0215 family